MIGYYGGKSKLIKYIEPLIPQSNEVNGFVDLFVGGGSVSDMLVKHYQSGIINDIDFNLIRFYLSSKSDSEGVKKFILEHRESVTLDDVRRFKSDISTDTNEMSVAFKYFTLIYTMFSNKPYSTPTEKNLRLYKKRNIDVDFDKISKTLRCVEIMNRDFKDVVYDDMFYYCDPPYFKVSHNTYYGYNGQNHKSFNHIDFFNWITEISKRNKVMISYEDSEEIRDMYKDWAFVEIPKKSSYFNSRTKEQKYKVTNELLIKNY